LEKLEDSFALDELRVLMESLHPLTNRKIRMSKKTVHLKDIAPHSVPDRELQKSNFFKT